MQTLTEFVDSFNGEDQYGPVSQVFDIMPSDSIIVCDEVDNIEYRLTRVLSDLFIVTNSYEVETDIGTFVVESNDIGGYGTKIFRVSWPTCEGGNASPIYVLTESYC